MDYATFIASVKDIFVALFPVVASEEWKGWKPEEVKSLNKLMHLFDDIFNVKLRPQYDQTFYVLAKTTKVVNGLEPVRKQTVRKGSDTETPDAAEIFDSLLGEDETAETSAE